MPLYDHERGFYQINASREWRNNQVIIALQRKLHPKRFNRMIETARESVQYVIDNTPNHCVIWTKTGAAVGHKSMMMPKRYLDHFWSCIHEVFSGDDKLCLMAAGTVMRLVIAERDEQWFVNRKETGHTDLVTGDPIMASQYWVNDSFVIPKKPKSKGFTMSDLAMKWGATART